MARSIEDPWFRCQALSFCAEHVRDARARDALLREAFDAASLLGEPNRIVSVSCWPLSVLCNLGLWGEVAGHARRLSAIISKEPSPVRRANALKPLCTMLRAAPHDISMPVFGQFAEACLCRLSSGKRNRRGESYLARMIPVIHTHAGRDWACELAARIAGPELRSQANEALLKLEKGEIRGDPRP